MAQQLKALDDIQDDKGLIPVTLTITLSGLLEHQVHKLYKTYMEIKTPNT